MYDVITIGSATRDAFLLSKSFQFIRSKKFSTGVGECVALGGKIDVEKLILSTGGGATNAAVAFARLGLRTACIARIGEDGPGRDVVHDLKAEGVDTSLMRVDPRGSTGYSTLLTAPNGERSVLVHRGVSANFTTKDIAWDKLRAKWIYLTSLGGNLSLARAIARAAHAHETRIMWNPGGLEIKKGLRAWKSLLPHIDILMINREEATTLTGTSDLRGVFAALQHKSSICLITDGDKGAHAARGDWMARAGTSHVRAISRTGAGDAFGSGFLAEYIARENLASALAVGTLNAESVIQRVGAKAGLLHHFPSRAAQKRIVVKTLS